MPELFESTSCTVLSLLRKAIWNEQITLPPEIEWLEVCTELKNQAVLPLVDNVLMAYCTDPEIRRTWSIDILSQLSHNEMNLYGQDRLLALLNANDIPAAILKGAAAARYYPRPENRVLGDVDCLVPFNRFEETIALLRENGYAQETNVTEGYCEVRMHKDHVVFDLHRGVNGNGGIDVAAVDGFVMEGLKTPEECIVGGYAIPVLPALADGLMQMSHIRQHVRGGLGLRQILDWMLYAAHNLDDDCWQDGFGPAARQCGVEKLAVTVTRLCQMYLGLTDEITWCKNADETLCTELMLYVLDSGNFGRKTELYSRASRYHMMRKNYLWKMLKGLQQSGKERSIVKKHPVLIPVAWLIQLSHYLGNTLKRGNAVKALYEDAKHVQRTQALMTALGIPLGE